MTRDRWVGIAVVLAAALALIAVNRVSGRDLPGQATAVQLLPVPKVGSCLDTRDPEPTPVGCDQRHTAEVYQSWRTGRTPADISDRCASGGGVSWSVPMNEDWSVPQTPTFTTKLSAGGTLGWEVCAFIATVDGDPSRALSYVGPLNRSSAGTPPAVIGTCFDGHRTQIDCATPHRIERVGVFLALGSDSTPTSSCANFARSVVGEPAFAGQDGLEAVTGLDRSGQPTVIDPATGDPVPVQTCSVVATRNLVDSVIGVGDKPLPFG